MSITDERRRSPRTRLGRVFAATLLVIASATAATADERWLLRGLLDAELWETDAESALLSRNEGDPGPRGRLRLWLAADLHPRLQVVGLGRFHGGSADDASGIESELDQAFLRASLGSTGRLFLEAGKFPTPLGNFSTRYLSEVNPLVGEPSSYGVSYPIGLQLAGSVERFDFRAALLDRPLTNGMFLPDAEETLRPALAVGVTPVVGARIGMYATRGTYLNDEIDADLPAGTRWRDLEQQVVGLDLHFSRGYLQIDADYSINEYDVPPTGDTLQGVAYFVETKYTWSPRIYTALRVGSNEYIAVKWFGSWVGYETAFDDYEVGAGYRLGAETLLKLSYRADSWETVPGMEGYYRDGHSLSLQLSHGFDVRSWFTPR